MPQKNSNLDLPKEPKMPWLSLVFCFLFPGLGQFYNNTKTQKLLGWMYVILMLLIVFVYSFFFDPTKDNGIYDTIAESLSFALTFASGVDAYRTAKEINQSFEQKESEI